MRTFGADFNTEKNSRYNWPFITVTFHFAGGDISISEYAPINTTIVIDGITHYPIISRVGSLGSNFTRDGDFIDIPELDLNFINLPVLPDFRRLSSYFPNTLESILCDVYLNMKKSDGTVVRERRMTGVAQAPTKYDYTTGELHILSATEKWLNAEVLHLIDEETYELADEAFYGKGIPIAFGDCPKVPGLLLDTSKTWITICEASPGNIPLSLGQAYWEGEPISEEDLDITMADAAGNMTFVPVSDPNSGNGRFDASNGFTSNLDEDDYLDGSVDEDLRFMQPWMTKRKGARNPVLRIYMNRSGTGKLAGQNDNLFFYISTDSRGEDILDTQTLSINSVGTNIELHYVPFSIPHIEPGRKYYLHGKLQRADETNWVRIYFGPGEAGWGARYRRTNSSLPITYSSDAPDDGALVGGISTMSSEIKDGGRLSEVSATDNSVSARGTFMGKVALKKGVVLAGIGLLAKREDPDQDVEGELVATLVNEKGDVVAEATFTADQLPEATVDESTPGSGGRSFLTLGEGLEQSVYGVTGVFIGGLAFRPDGDILATECLFSGSPLHRWNRNQTSTVNDTVIHDENTPLLSSAGCGLCNHPNGYLYSNTEDGIVKLNAQTGDLEDGPYGPAGNALGVAVDPDSERVIYVSATGSMIWVEPDFSANGVFSSVTEGEAFIDGLLFSPGGGYLYCANRAPNRITILNGNNGTLNQHIDVTAPPDGFAFHENGWVASFSTNGSITKIAFSGGWGGTPTVEEGMATGGFRCDLTVVGSDGYAYVSMNGTRYNNDVETSENSIVAIGPGFHPFPGVPIISTAPEEMMVSSVELVLLTPGTYYLGVDGRITEDGEHFRNWAFHGLRLNWAYGSHSTDTWASRGAIGAANVAGVKRPTVGEWNQITSETDETKEVQLAFGLRVLHFDRDVRNNDPSGIDVSQLRPYFFSSNNIKVRRPRLPDGVQVACDVLSPITRPDAVFHWLLNRAGVPDSLIDLSGTFAASGALYGEDYKFRGAVVNQLTYKSLLARLAFECRSVFMWNWDKAQLKFLPTRATAGLKTLPLDDVVRTVKTDPKPLLTVTRTEHSEVINEFDAQWRRDYTKSSNEDEAYARTRRFTNAASVAAFGVLSTGKDNRLFKFDYIHDGLMLSLVCRHWRDWMAYPYRMVTFSVKLNHLEIEPYDIVDLSLTPTIPSVPPSSPVGYGEGGFGEGGYGGVPGLAASGVLAGEIFDGFGPGKFVVVRSVSTEWPTRRLSFIVKELP